MALIKLTLVLLSMALTLEAIPLFFPKGPLVSSLLDKCPQRNPKEFFDGDAVKSKLVGRWYKHSSNVPESFTLFLKCSYSDLKPDPNTNGSFTLEENLFVPLPFMIQKVSHKGILEQEDPNAAKFNFTIIPPLVKEKLNLTLQVLATDGNDYAILSYCKEFSSFNRSVAFESLVVLTKNAVVTDSAEEAIQQAINVFLPNEKYKLSRISQSGCHYT